MADQDSAEAIAAEVAQREKVIAAELSLTRARAASWAQGIGALLATALAFSLIRGRSDLTTLADRYAAAVGLVLLAASLGAIIAAYFLFRASFGPLHPIPLSVSDHDEAASTMRALRWGIGVAVVSFGLLLTAVGLTWFGPSGDKPSLAVTNTGGVTWCGTPLMAKGGTLRLDVDGQEIEIDLDAIVKVIGVDSCPEP